MCWGEETTNLVIGQRREACSTLLDTNNRDPLHQEPNVLQLGPSLNFGLLR